MMTGKDEEGIALTDAKQRQDLDSLEYNDDDLEDIDFSKTETSPSSFLPEKKESGYMTKFLDHVVHVIVWIQYQWIFNRVPFVLGCIASTLILLMVTGIVEKYEGPKGKLGGLFRDHYDAHIDHIPYWTTIKSKMDLNRDKIDHWCLDRKVKEGDCNCADPMIPEAKFMDRNWRKALKNNRKEVDAAVAEKYQMLYNHKDENETLAEIQTEKEIFRTVDVVFLGDSITEARTGRESGRASDDLKSIKNEFIKQFRSPNSTFVGMALGIAGDTTPNLLWRIDHGDEVHLDMDAKVYWITIGINDLLVSQCSDEVVLVGIINIVEELKIKKPDSFIVMNSILPMHMKTHPIQDSHGNKFGPWRAISTVNDALHQFAQNTKHVKFFDATKIFTAEDENGDLYTKDELYQDSVHPNRRGQKKWMRRQTDYLQELIGEVDSTPTLDPLSDDIY